MARVTIVGIVAGTIKDGVVRGRPSGVKKIDVVPGAFASAGSPDWTVPANTEALMFISDTSIDFAVVRTNNAATVETAVPLPVCTGGLSYYIMSLEDGDVGGDIFIRAMA